MKKSLTRFMSFFLSFVLAFTLAIPTFADDGDIDVDDDWDAEFAWTEVNDWTDITDKYVCEVIFTYIGDNDELNPTEYGPYECEVTGVIDTEPNCENDGTIIYTASYTFEVNEKEYTDTKKETISAFGHEYGEPEFEWADDYSSCVAVFTCARCEDVQKVECEVTCEVIDPSCTESGTYIYTATAVFEGETYTDTKYEDIDPLGHDYGDPTFVWADDGSSVTAYFPCTRCDFILDVDGDVYDHKTTVEPWCETTGIETYYGKVEVEFGEGTYYTEHDVVLDALGHDWYENKQTVHYDEVSYWDISIVYESRYVCGECGWYREDVTGMSESNQGSDMDGHQITTHGHRTNYTTTYVNVGVTGEWVTNSLAHDETVTDWSTTYCARCNQKYDHEHEYNDPIFIWSNDGTELEAMFICSLGDDVRIVKGVVTSCEIVAVNEDQPREATCTKDGQVASYGYVEFDGKIYSTEQGSIIPALGHDYNMEYVTENGKTYAVFTCSRCGDVQEIDATTLDYEVVVEPTCTENGLGIYSGTIDLDGTTESISVEEVIPALGHEWPEKPTPNWVSDGTLEGTTFSAYAECTRGDAVVQLGGEIARTEIETEPTCTNKGLMWVIGQTTYDGKVWESKYPLSINATGHTWGDTIVITPATCSTDGLGTHTCTVCGASEEVEIPANGEHVYSENPEFIWSNDYETCNAMFHCDLCNEYQLATCEITRTEIEPTCYQEGELTLIAYCTMSGKTYTDIKTFTLEKTEHEFEASFEWAEDYSSCTAVFVCIHCKDSFMLNCETSDEIVQEASCSQEGVTVHHATAVNSDGSKYTDNDGKNYTDVETEVIEKLPHTVVIDEGYDATCTESGMTDGEHCSVCSEVLVQQDIIPALGHVWEETVVTEPTCTSVGAGFRICSRCENYETYEIPMIDHIYTNDIVFDWSEDYSKCTVTFTCDMCGQSVTYDCTITTTSTAPTHDSDGRIDYSASYEMNGIIYRDEKSQIIPSTGHEFDKPEFVWSDDYSSCTAIFTCVVCGEQIEENCDVAYQVTKEATCQNEGLATFTAVATFEAAVYSDVKDVVLDKLPHTPEVINGFDATCTEPGLTDGEVCAVCGEVIVAQEVIPALGHDWDNGIITTEPTCTETGVKTYTCKRCGQTRTEAIDALGHNWGETAVIYEATCTKDGLGKHTCTRCGINEDVDIPALGHDWSAWEIVEKSTCSEEGIEERVCSRCGEVDTEPMEKLPHTVVIDAAIEPTCVDAGLTAGEHCSVCGEVLIAQETIPASGIHAYGEWTTVKEATATEDGLEARYCTVCGAEQTQSIPKLETLDGTTHEHTWDDGTITKEATCTTLGETTYTCTVCGATETIADIPATDHSYTEVEYIWTDENCNQIFVDPATGILLGATDEFVWDKDVTCEALLHCPDCDADYEVDCNVVVIEDEDGIHYYAYPSETNLSVYNEITTDADGNIIDVKSVVDVLTGAEVGEITAQRANEHLYETVLYKASADSTNNNNSDSDSNKNNGNGSDDGNNVGGVNSNSTNSFEGTDSGSVNETSGSNNGTSETNSGSGGTTATDSVVTGDVSIVFYACIFILTLSIIGITLGSKNKKSSIK